MASHHLPLLFLLILSSTFLCSCEVLGRNHAYSYPCSKQNNTCNSSLYHVVFDDGRSKDEIASLYSVKASQMKSAAGKKDYLISVPCSCQSLNETNAYFYDVIYAVQQGNTFSDVNNQIYSGQVWSDGADVAGFKKGTGNVTLHLLCGCIESKSQTVVTYTVQPQDTLSMISALLYADINEIESMNTILTSNPSFIYPGDVLFVPMENSGRLPAPKAKLHKWTIVIILLSAVTLITISTLIIVLHNRKRNQQKSGEDPKNVSKSICGNRVLSMRNQYLHNGTMEDMTAFESERPAVFSLEEIEASTKNFDEARIIGVGGYGSVYYGELEGKEVAIKKMRSNKSKEFFAELKVLCKIHHINVVELLGYASGDDHLYLVYEFMQNGSLSAHLHDPLMKGHQPLPWSARTQIAVDAARGIEYIHDHTKARYVHRDIKTANILLDQCLRGKVADFGLVKLVGRTNENDLVATRLVGTPGYLPPESVKELQVTTKTDVFAFGVVLAELITGKRALIRNNQEPNKTRSLITTIKNVFETDDPEAALEAEIDKNLGGNYPIEDVIKMAEIAEWCLSEEATDRPEINEIIVPLTQIMMASAEWEASLGGDSLVFNGLSRGR